MTSYPRRIHVRTLFGRSKLHSTYSSPSSYTQIEDFPCNAAVVDINGGVFWNCDGMWLREDRLEENIGDFPPGSRGVIDRKTRYVRGHECWLLIEDPAAPQPYANHLEQVSTAPESDTTRFHHSPGDSEYSRWNAPSLSGSPCLINKSFHLAQ